VRTLLAICAYLAKCCTRLMFAALAAVVVVISIFITKLPQLTRTDAVVVAGTYFDASPQILIAMAVQEAPSVLSTVVRMALGWCMGGLPCVAGALVPANGN